MKRFRHLRSNQEIRDRSAEVVLSADEFILPLFIVEGTGQRNEISSMKDGQVDSIRTTLDGNGLYGTRIMSYSAKYASAFYGPFRDAVKSSPAFGDRKSYQLDYRTICQGIEEAEADLSEGADWIMVKPAHAYLDMIQRIKSKLGGSTLAAYHVSGEYMLLKTAAMLGLVDELTAFTEVTMAIKRAGADYIITYYAGELADSIHQF